VVRSQWLTPHLVRVVLGGEDVAALDVGPFTDRYVKLEFAVADADRPALRTYTISGFDADAGELSLDFVVHGDGVGLAAPWAASAQPGDLVSFRGPGGDYAPSPDASWHLLIGDDSALPAIAASVAALPAGAVARVLVEVPGPDAELSLAGPDGTDVAVEWVHRDHGDTSGAALVRAVAEAALPAGEPEVFLHGEAGAVRALRLQLRAERGYSRESLGSVSGYWRAGRTDEGWRAEKPAWKAAVEQDDDRVAAT
jgi:NADPH-dependent ferric siderophore reductase